MNTIYEKSIVDCRRPKSAKYPNRKENQKILCSASGLNHQHHSPGASALPIDQSGVYTNVKPLIICNIHHLHLPNCVSGNSACTCNFIF